MVDKIKVMDFPDSYTLCSREGETYYIEATDRNMEFLMDKINEIIDEINRPAPSEYIVGGKR